MRCRAIRGWLKCIWGSRDGVYGWQLTVGGKSVERLPRYPPMSPALRIFLEPGRQLSTVNRQQANAFHTEPQPILRWQPHPLGCEHECAGGVMHLSHGAKWDGEDHAAEMHHGAAAILFRARAL